MPITREQLRTLLLAEADKVQSTWILWRAMSQQERNLSLASRQCLSQNSPETNAYLDEFLTYYNTMQFHLNLRSAIEPPVKFAHVMDLFGAAFSAIWKWLLTSFGL